MIPVVLRCQKLPHKKKGSWTTEMARNLLTIIMPLVYKMNTLFFFLVNHFGRTSSNHYPDTVKKKKDCSSNPFSLRLCKFV